jgi:hypothetical protein
MFHGKVSFALSGLGLSKAKDPTETRSMERQPITTGGGDKSCAAAQWMPANVTVIFRELAKGHFVAARTFRRFMSS